MHSQQEEVISQLLEIDAYEFEHLIADLWEQRGWNTEVTQGSNDRGIDIVAEKSEPFYQKQVIQAKRYKIGNKIGSPDIQQYSSLRHQESNVDAVVIVTTSSFSKQAKEAATDLNVKLVDGEELYKIIQKENARDIINQYIETGLNGHPESNISDLKKAAEEVNSNPVIRQEPEKSDESGSSKTKRIVEWFKKRPEANQEPKEEPIPWTKFSYFIAFSAIVFYPLFGIGAAIQEMQGASTVPAYVGIPFYGVWIGAIIAVVFDSKTIARYSPNPPYYRAYGVGFFFLVMIFPLIAVVYLYRRKRLSNKYD